MAPSLDSFVPPEREIASSKGESPNSASATVLPPLPDPVGASLGAAISGAVGEMKSSLEKLAPEFKLPSIGELKLPKDCAAVGFRPDPKTGADMTVYRCASGTPEQPKEFMMPYDPNEGAPSASSVFPRNEKKGLK